MKKALLFIPSIALLTSCYVYTSYGLVQKGAVSGHNGNSFFSQYNYSDGSETCEFDVKEMHTLTIRCEITTKSGEINFSISPRRRRIPICQIDDRGWQIQRRTS